MSDSDIQPSEQQPNGNGKKITLQTIAIIIGFCVQAVCFVWYGAQDDALLRHTVNDVNVINTWKNDQANISVRTEARLSVIEERTKDQGDTLHRIEDKMEYRKR